MPGSAIWSASALECGSATGTHLSSAGIKGIPSDRGNLLGLARDVDIVFTNLDLLDNVVAIAILIGGFEVRENVVAVNVEEVASVAAIDGDDIVGKSPGSSQLAKVSVELLCTHNGRHDGRSFAFTQVGCCRTDRFRSQDFARRGVI